MTQYSPELNYENVSTVDLSDKQSNGMAIEKVVKETGIGYLEATTAWLEENSLSESSFSRYIPNAIVDKIKLEAQENNYIRPSLSKTKSKGDLGFLL